MARKSSLSVGLDAVAKGKALELEEINENNEPTATKTKSKERKKTVLIGAQFDPDVRAALHQVQSVRENHGKELKELLGEAINLLCAKYGKPEPYTVEK